MAWRAARADSRLSSRTQRRHFEQAAYAVPDPVDLLLGQAVQHAVEGQELESRVVHVDEAHQGVVVGGLLGGCGAGLGAAGVAVGQGRLVAVMAVAEVDGRVGEGLLHLAYGPRVADGPQPVADGALGGFDLGRAVLHGGGQE